VHPVDVAAPSLADFWLAGDEETEETEPARH